MLSPAHGEPRRAPAPAGFGLIVIGNEILDGRRSDAHIPFAVQLLKERHMPLRYAMILPDDPLLLLEQLRWCMRQNDPFFCCGGIGSTPDDYTRDCAARAAGVATEPHAEAVAILKERFGRDATPARLKMVEFPAGAELIPNPVNRVPGFHIRNGYFLPGFPQMAAPMMEWILDTAYEPAAPRIERAILLPGCREADIVAIMDTFLAGHTDVSFSSLPRFTDTGTEVLLGLAGPPAAVEQAHADLQALLRKAGVAFDA